MSRTHLIGLSGYAGAGKDEVAKILGELGWEKDAFANRVREFAYHLNPPVTVQDGGQLLYLRNVVDSHGWDRAKREFPEVRGLLQRLGTDAGRRIFGENIWVHALMNSHNLGWGKRLVVSDVRFPNEYRAILDAGGTLMWIIRPGVEPTVDELGVVHESETALDGHYFDHVIVNDGTLDDLKTKVLEALIVDSGARADARVKSGWRNK